MKIQPPLEFLLQQDSVTKIKAPQKRLFASQVTAVKI